MPETNEIISETEKNSKDSEKESVADIKEEIEIHINVKPEPVECMVCVGHSPEGLDIQCTNTSSGTCLYQYLSKFTAADLRSTHTDTKYVCKSCFDLINVLETAELEYMKLKETFESIISKNPLFDNHAISYDTIKNEAEAAVKDTEDDSEDDEPLALTKKKRHRKVEKRKKTVTESKRRARRKYSKERLDDSEQGWECGVCGARGESGGALAGAAHALVAHASVVKKEDSDRSQSPTINQFDGLLKIEEEGFEDDDEYVPDSPAAGNGTFRRAGKRGPKPKVGGARKKREARVLHPCDQCNAKYTSLRASSDFSAAKVRLVPTRRTWAGTKVRLEQHKLKHDDSKPPYICEVCGAHYKHKRACDIHVAMHKGISDWKCEECNKLFPSKGALQRHNNIHTGKLNYQCDLCGKSFIHTSSFKMHKLSHSGVKPHACDVCGLALMTRSHLKRHKRVHSGEKRHECAVCGKRFSERYNLLAHSKSHEGEAAAAQPQPQPQPRRRLFRCGFCPDRFERRYMLERHMGAAHGRALERPPPTPRNTMSKLLKAQALRRDPAGAAAPTDESKLNRSPESRLAGGAVIKQISTASAQTGTPAAWAGAYAAEFGLRHDYSH